LKEYIAHHCAAEIFANDRLQIANANAINMVRRAATFNKSEHNTFLFDHALPMDRPASNFTPELSQHGHGRFSRNPLQVPWTDWKDILWRT
jgi:hypothetical protein